MIDPHPRLDHVPSPRLVLLYNIRMCVEPLLHRFEDMRRLLATTLAGGSGALSAAAVSVPGVVATRPAVQARQQRAYFHRVDSITPEALLFDVLYQRTLDVGAFASLARWLVSVDSNNSNSRVTDHAALRAAAQRVGKHYTAVCFFGVKTDFEMLRSAHYFAVVGTLSALAQRYPELNLNSHHVKHVGYCSTLGPYLVVHNDALWMLRHAMLNFVLTADGRVYRKNTPVYPLLVNTYVTRNVTPALRPLLEQPQHRGALFEPLDAFAAPSLPPVASEPNVFALRCLVDTLGEWLDLPAVTCDDGAPWRLGVPSPRSPYFGAMRMLHRLVDQLQTGHAEIDTRPGDNPQRDLHDYNIDEDSDALNAVRSFLQLRLPHSLGYDTYVLLKNTLEAIAQQVGGTQNMHRQQLALLQFLQALAPLAQDATRAEDSHSYCNRLTFELMKSVVATTVVPEPTTRKRTRVTHGPSFKTARRSELSNVASFERRTTHSKASRVPLLPIAEVLARLPADHPLLAVASGEYSNIYDLVCHVNLLVYSLSLSNALELGQSYQLLCDLQATGTRIDPATLFSTPRYSGATDRALINFRYVKQHYEANVLKPRGKQHAVGRVALAYSAYEPMNALVKLLMRLDYCVTCGRPAVSSAASVQALASVVPSESTYREHDAMEQDKPAGEVDIHTALPIQIEEDSRNVRYMEDSLLLFSVLAYEECQVALGASALASLEMATVQSAYQDMTSLARELRARFTPYPGAAAVYTGREWILRRREQRSKVVALEEARKAREEAKIARCGQSVEAFLAAMEEQR
jgi:hypothetical protein